MPAGGVMPAVGATPVGRVRAGGAPVGGAAGRCVPTGGAGGVAAIAVEPVKNIAEAKYSTFEAVFMVFPRLYLSRIGYES